MKLMICGNWYQFTNWYQELLDNTPFYLVGFYFFFQFRPHDVLKEISFCCFIVHANAFGQHNISKKQFSGLTLHGLQWEKQSKQAKKVYYWSQKVLWLSSILLSNSSITSLSKQSTCWDATADFAAKWCVRKNCSNSILMIHHYPDLGSASDWLKICSVS